MKTIRAAILAAYVLPLCSLAEPKQWTQGDPSAEEQAALEVINRLRADPEGAVAFYGRAEIQQRDPIVAAALRDVRAPRYADGFVGFSAARIGQAPVDYVSGVEGARAMMTSRVQEMLRARAQNGGSPIDGAEPPLPPLVLYPALSAQAAAQFQPAMAGNDFAVVRSYFFADDNTRLLPNVVNTPAMWAQAAQTAFRAPSLSGPSATGGTAIIRAGVPPVGQSLAHYWRGHQLLLCALYDSRVSLKEALLTQNFQPAEFLKDIFGWQADDAARRTYGRSRMVGVHLSAAWQDAPGAGTRVLSFFRVDDDAVDADLPYGTATRFITGVVYTDKNLDGSYSTGEGVSGVRVSVGDEWYAVSSTSGGFSVPVRAGAGVVNVVAAGANPGDGSAFQAMREHVVGDENVKADFVLSGGFVKPSQSTVAASVGTTDFSNLSTRGVAEKGDGALVGGFAITGQAGKRLLIRAMCNTLLEFGVRGVLRKPRLRIVHSSGAVVREVRTQDIYVYTAAGLTVRPELVAASRTAGAFDFSLSQPPYPGTSRIPLTTAGAANGFDAFDAAAVIDLAPGAYSVVVEPDSDSYIGTSIGDANGPLPERIVMADPQRYPTWHGLTWGSSGIVLLEIYDLTPQSASRFTNLSTRGRVEPGDREMIVGFTIGGNGARRLLVRGVSPTLAGFGVGDVLDDTVITAYHGGAPIAMNDDWGNSPYADQVAMISAAVGAFPLQPTARDSATLIRVAPGSYSVRVGKGAGRVSGVALAELYLTDP